MTHNKPLSERFWAKVDRSSDDNACWNWTRGTSPQGYGKVGCILDGVRVQLAHRVAYILTYGQVARGICILHECDNPSCCNPKHLFPGTRLDNNRDMVQKGRNAKGKRISQPGEANGYAKLTDEKVRYIRARYADGDISMAKLGKEVGIKTTTVFHVVSGNTWGHVK